MDSIVGRAQDGGGAPQSDDGAIVAAIAAAIAAAAGSDAASLRVVSYRRTGQTAPAWNIQGRSEYLSGKL